MELCLEQAIECSPPSLILTVSLFNVLFLLVESHAGQIFCCIGALSIGGALHMVDEDLLGWWLSERQCDSGGLNGRPEKQADVCYSWWILSSLAILGRVLLSPLILFDMY